MLAGCKPASPRSHAGATPLAAGTTRVNPIDGLTYVWIAPGTFIMGCTPGNCQDEEQPAQTVTIEWGYWIGQTPVTVGAWRKYRTANGVDALPTSDSAGRKNLNEAGDDKMPVVLVNFDAAKKYCEWAGGGLPDESRWEFAARAGTGGVRDGSLDAIAWHADNSGKGPIDSAALVGSNNYERRMFLNGDGPHPVATKAPNAWNLYDMLGDVMEWTENAEVKNGNLFNPTYQYVKRGCSWYDPPKRCRESHRIDWGAIPLVVPAMETDGFRCDVGEETAQKWPAPTGSR